MKAAWLAGMMLLGCGSLRAEDERTVLRFATPEFNQLSGSLESLDGDILVWNSRLLDRPSPFFTKEVLELTLPTVFPDHEASHLATLTLEPWPEDKVAPRIRGQLVAVTDDKIILDTWYAGRLEINRLHVKAVDIEDPVKFIFSGPVGLEGWAQGAKGGWTYDNGWLRSEGAVPIGRSVDLPDACSVAFDLSWRGQLGCRFCLFVDDPKAISPDRGYQLDLQSGYANLHKLNSRGGDSRMAGVPELRNKERVRIEVRANRKTGDFCLFVNGRYVMHWRDPEGGKARMGNGFQFCPTEAKRNLGVAKVRVTSWDGDIGTPPENDEMNPWMGGMRRLQAPRAEEPPAPKADDATGRMLLRNGDSIAGEVVAIADGNIMVKTPFAEVKLPVSRVRNISLKPASLEQPIRRKGDVRAWFADGSSLCFRLKSVGKDTIIGSSQIFGRAEFKLAAFNRIEFNIHDPRIRELREKLGD